MNWMTRRRREVRRRRAVRAAQAAGCGTALLLVAGFFLPPEIGISGQLLVDRPPETIWRVLTDFDGMPLWRSDLVGLERLPDHDSRPTWREIRRGSESVVELAVAEPPGRLVFRRARDGRPSLPSSTFLLTATAGRTLVTLTQRMEVRNPFRRVLHRLHPPRSALLRFLRDLDLRVSGSQRQVAAVKQ